MIGQNYPTDSPRERPRRARLPADLGPRIAVAVPAASVLVALNHVGGLAFAIPLVVLGALGLLELVRLLTRAPRAVGLTVLALPWLVGGLVHAILLRGLDHGAGLMIAVLLAVFIGDTAAQLAGTAFGQRRLAPRISPSKTVEGLAAGIVVGTAACAIAAFFHDWLSLGEAVLLGLACTLAAPAGDLFESVLKRRAGVKDSGRTFGAHGGVLDRVDAALAAVAVGYYVALALAL